MVTIIAPRPTTATAAATKLQPARPPPPAPASLVDMTITDHNNPHDNGHCHNEPHVPGERMYCSTAFVVELRSSKEIVATFGWLEDLPMKSDDDGNVHRLQFFLCFIFCSVFHVNFVFFVGATCQCLSMLGTIVFMN